MENMIKQIDEKLNEWTEATTKERFIEIANEFFDRDIR